MRVPPPLPKGVRALTTTYGRMTAAQVRTLHQCMRNSPSDDIVSLAFNTDTYHEERRERFVTAKFSSGVSMNIRADGHVDGVEV